MRFGALALAVGLIGLTGCQKPSHDLQCAVKAQQFVNTSKKIHSDGTSMDAYKELEASYWLKRSGASREKMESLARKVPMSDIQCDLPDEAMVDLMITAQGR